MSCYKPLIRLYNPDNKEISGRVYTLARFSELSGKKLKYEDVMYNPKVMLIPCGQCIGCRIRQREDWTTRIELEARNYKPEEVWFITLTYDDDHVPGMILKTGELLRKAQYYWKPGSERPESVQILLYTDIQNFLKRLRKTTGSKLRYFCAGEYGEKTARPHYHMILYGWKPNDLKQLYKIHHNGYYTSETLCKIWGQGNVQIAQAVPETYRYVAGYVTKKMYEIDGKKGNQYYEMGQPKPFACMSLKPGIGDEYYQKHKDEIWGAGYIQCSNGKKAQIPRFYEKMMEREDPERLWAIKRKRQAELIAQNKFKYEGFDYGDELKTKERIVKKTMKQRGKL
nr:MAG TPA: Replication associated protein [Microviridae sp.]